MPGRLHHIPAGLKRLAWFVAASFMLHAVTLVGVQSSGVASAPHRGAARPEALHATLNIHERVEPVGLSGERERASQPPATAATADTRSGAPAGADLPFPDRWYTAAELDVRAEPVGEVQLDYPEELEGTGIPGKVRLLLFIDERGVVRRLRITEAEPARIFDKAALRAWTGVAFTPAQKGGVAVKSQKLLELDFKP